MASTNMLIADNVGYLRQGVALIRILDDAAYAEPGSVYQKSGVGSHFRHCTDHYDQFLDGLPEGRIDYDSRQRNESVERVREAGIEKLEDLAGRLETLAADGMDDRPLAVKMDCGDASDERTWWSTSSLRRELQFLLSHTVHHYALIVMMLRERGVEAGPEFGVAPSTLRYHHAGVSCAQ